MSSQQRNNVYNNATAQGRKLGHSGKEHLRGLAGVFTSTMNLDKAGGGNYLGNPSDMRNTYNMARQLGVGGGGVTHAAQALASWITGGETGRIMGRMQSQQALRTANLGDGRTYNQLIGESNLSAADKALRDKQAKLLREAGAKGTGAWNKQRIARGATRSTAVAAGIAAVDFLNPFSMGWND